MPLVLAFVLVFAALLGWRGPSTLGAPDLPEIPEVHAQSGVAALTLRAELDPQGRPAFFWHGREVAPTIRVRPGDVIRVHYINALPEFCGLGMVSDSNLHFHGLTTSPRPPGDDVLTTMVAPARAFDYTVRIGRNQPPGLYWYHPHAHGLANWELGNGMAGAIVIEGIADEVPSLAGLRERVIVLRDIPRDPSVGAAESKQQLTAGPLPTAQAQTHVGMDDEDYQGDTPCGVDADAQPTINGIPSATLAIAPGERQLWRVLNASGKRHYDLAIAGVRMQLAARDGIPIKLLEKTPEHDIDHVLLPPGGRAEIVVTGAAHPQLLLSRCYDGGKAGEPNPGVIFGELVDDRGTNVTTRVAPPFGVANDRDYTALPARVAQHRTIYFREDANGFSLNGKRFSPGDRPMFVARAGTTEEWTLDNRSDEVHAFHIHQVHFVVEATHEWRDVVDVPPRAKLRIIVDFRDPIIRGTFLFHCHLTDHEDGGMMGKIKVI
ncbi:MAG TPA: multicopper oxidase family protein [Candidatus Baltobacteraceae bacterium]